MINNELSVVIVSGRHLHAAFSSLMAQRQPSVMFQPQQSEINNLIVYRSYNNTPYNYAVCVSLSYSPAILAFTIANLVSTPF